MADNNAFDKTLPIASPEHFADPRFKIQKRLGSGGMGDVYLAEDSTLHRLVALKTVRPDLCKNEEIRKRIERECLLHARVGAHPHIVTLFDKLEHGDDINLVMEYVEGGSLQETFRECTRKGFEFSKKDSLEIASQVLDALSRIHAQGIVHRDIKPENILLTRDESGAFCAKLMDFGIARLQDPEEQATCLTSVEGSGPGTPIYMAPEQIDQKTYGSVSPATDIYAVGIMLYQLLTGELPFMGTITEIFRGHLTGIPPALDPHAEGAIPALYADVLRRALAKRPADRFPSARAFREELLRLAASLSGGAHKSAMAAPDSSRTVIASSADVAAADAGGTRLAGSTTAQRPSSGKKRVVLVLVVLAAIAVVAVAAAWAFMRQNATPVSEPPAQPATPVPSQTPEVTTPPPAPSVAIPAQTPPSVPPAPSPAPAAAQPPAVAPLPPAASAPASPSEAPAASKPVEGGGGSAFDELIKGRQSKPEPPAPAAVTEPKPEPKPPAPPQPPPEPKTAPAQQPKPETKPPPPPEPKPEPSPPQQPASEPNWMDNITGGSSSSQKIK